MEAFMDKKLGYSALLSSLLATSLVLYKAPHISYVAYSNLHQQTGMFSCIINNLKNNSVKHIFPSMGGIALSVGLNNLKEKINPGYPLLCCTCISLQERRNFIKKFVGDITKTFPDRTQSLVYTSLCSGSLLQDYLTLEKLLDAGYLTIKMNLIDFYYRNNPPIFKYFKRKVLELIREKAPRAVVTLAFFPDAYSFCSAVAEGLCERTNIFVMVDPDTKLFDSSLKTSNVIVTPGKFIVIKPHYGKVSVKKVNNNSFMQGRNAQTYGRDPFIQQLEKLLNSSMMRKKMLIAGDIDTLLEKGLEHNQQLKGSIKVDPHISFYDIIKATHADTMIGRKLYKDPSLYTLYNDKITNPAMALSSPLV